MSKKCTPLWRSTFRSQHVKNIPGPGHFWKLRCRKSARRCGEAHFEVKMCKTHHVRTVFAGSDVVSRGRRQAQGIVHFVTSEQKHEGFVAFSTTTTTTPHCTPIRPTTTTTTPSLHSTTFHYIPLHSNTFHYIPPHSTTFHYTTLHYTPPHPTTLTTTTTTIYNHNNSTFTLRYTALSTPH